MKKTLILLIYAFCFTGYSQIKDKDLMYMVIENFSYKPNSEKLKLDLVIKNNSNKTLYFINPKKYFFSNHNQTKKTIKSFNLYYNKPYSITVSPHKDCYNTSNKKSIEQKLISNIKVKEGAEIAEEKNNEITNKIERNNAIKKSNRVKKSSLKAASKTSTKIKNINKEYQTNPYSIIDEIIEIPAKKFKKFKNIEINRSYGSFCKDTEYSININYYSYVVIQTQIKTFENYLKNNNIKAIEKVLKNQFSMLKKDSRLNNKENFEHFIKKYRGMLETNGKNFNSNKIKNN